MDDTKAGSFDQNARIEAENEQRRLSYLYRATSTLFGETLDFARRLHVLTRLLVPDLGDWCWIDLVDHVPVRMITYHWDEARLRDQPGGPAEPSAVDRQLQIPLLDSAGLIGHVTVRFVESNRQYRPDDELLAREIVTQAAWALDAARQYERATRATTAREDILAVVAHDLRTPIGNVLRAAELLEQTELSDPQLQLLQRAVRAGTRMDKLVRDLLDWGAIESGRLRVDVSKVGAKSLLDDVVDQFGLVVDPRVVVELPPAPVGATLVSCDPVRTSQVFSNLIGNAVKFAPKGSIVRVVCTPLPGALEFSVADHGPGIAPTHLEHIFERYWQVEGGTEQRRGVGLGLAIAKGIVEAQGGTLSARSVLGEGSTFVFTIPVAP
ncbi:MAG: HAMP domain-containing sensor histidine kinase [Kofleriaceae bacterium]